MVYRKLCAPIIFSNFLWFADILQSSQNISIFLGCRQTKTKWDMRSLFPRECSKFRYTGCRAHQSLHSEVFSHINKDLISLTKILKHWFWLPHSILNNLSRGLPDRETQRRSQIQKYTFGERLCPSPIFPEHDLYVVHLFFITQCYVVILIVPLIEACWLRTFRSETLDLITHFNSFKGGWTQFLRALLLTQFSARTSIA